ncbi:hydrogenase expression protein HypF [Streptomyces sp. NPDC018031]|uniref:hydrogenase expression protein HypF n=1 Tax=Streptomyces sp. NPDC018031 TaxID=3365033 RepID=UPI0037A4C409
MGGTVRGDEKPGAREAEADAPRRAKSGPRHAAPRKSVLTRLQVPAGKAIALAAMPTAVLMGMGLTPQLANANPRAEDRFKAGPCVSRSDEVAQDAEAVQESKDGNKSKDGKGTDDGKDAPSRDSGKDGGEPSPGPSSTPDAPAGKDTPEPAPSGRPDDGDQADAPAGEPAAEKPADPAPAPEETYDPWDPLGLGQKIEDLFTGGGTATQQPAPEPTPTATAEPTTKAPEPDGTAEEAPPKTDETARDTTDAAKDAVADAEDAAEDTEDAAGAEDSADEADPEPSGPATPDADDPAGYPCPEFDAEAYENAKGEATEALLPEDPWILQSSRLDLHGLDYHGIVEVKTYSGKVKKVLKFTATGIDIRDLHQLVVGPGGTTSHVEARKGSTSTIDNGTVTMYTEELSGNLLGLIPVTFSPKSPPPLTLPELFFTKVKVVQAGQFGGDLTIPGMHLYKTGG